ncbi:hypothetical protein AVEN_42821-1 [Araneus ventricosus]|uniref:Mos1 transposase HTH domain-containing protein n=1 Tax=Araneus ventricosus TaxID=182803 RepID=A0A4Y2AGA9_ARAVE|nr:hypothetical protein AVEN_42821-1 [Araneus ventricosus]
MASQLETYSNVEVRGTVRFLWAKRFTSTEIHSGISAVYGPHAMSRPTIVKWCQQFEDGRTDLTDAERQGKPTTVSTSDMVQRVEDIIHSNGRVSVTHTAQNVGISAGRPPCDFHVFCKLKEYLVERQFSSDDQVQTAVLSWLQDQGAIFYRQGIERSVQRSDKSLQILGDCVEK